jgi:molybdate transport system substrate-binding protein
VGAIATGLITDAVDLKRCTIRIGLHRNRSVVAAAAFWLACGGIARAQTLTIAAASDLQAVLPAIAQNFEKETRVTTRVTFGSSGNFFSQLQNGAPFDVFLSADLDYPQQLISSGQAIADTLYEYGSGRIVVWARSDAGLDLRRGLHALTEARVRRIAIANPAHAPYGRAAVEALRHENLYDAVQPKLVLGENISQAAQFVQSGNADAGILALSVALAPALKSSGVYTEIPSSMHPPIRQGAVVLRGSKNQQAARDFLAFLKRPESLKLLADFGFGIKRE